MLYPVNYGDNPWFPHESDFEVKTKNNLEGKGVFCLRPFKKGALVAVIHGEVIEEINQHTLQIDEHSHLYDIYFTGYLLHSCDPNVVVDVKKRTVHALKDIAANSWLYMDYSSTEDRLFKDFFCSCGAENCREFITGRLSNTEPAKNINMVNSVISGEQ